jgi:peptide/nickel transport system substrate-binding protein
MSRTVAKQLQRPAQTLNRCIDIQGAVEEDFKQSSGSSVTRRRLLRTGIATAGSAAGLLLSRQLPAGAHAGMLAQTTEDTLVIATNRTPTDLDPHSAYDAGSRIVLQGIFESLIWVKPGTTDQYRPLLAESWESNADHTVWTFRLRDGLAFQDGTPCDAAAVQASFSRLLAMGYGPSTVIGRFVTDAAQIAALDAQTVAFNLAFPAPLFEAAIASATVSAVVNAQLALQHEVDGDWGHTWAQTTAEGMGTGPYRLTSFDIAEAITFEANQAYWGGWAGDHFSQIKVRVVPEEATRRELVESGDVDITDNLSPDLFADLAAEADLVVDLRYNLTVRYMMLNQSGPLESVSARQALCYAFPYENVINGVYEGYAKRAIGPCAELLRGFAPGTYVFETDLDQARALLDVAGVAPGTTLSIVIPTGVAQGESIAQLLGANLAEIGLNLDIQQIDFASFVDIYYGDLPAEQRPNLLPSFWSPDYNDGWNHLWPQLSSNAWNSGNAGHYRNDRVDQLLNEAQFATEEAAYNEALAEIQQIATKDDPAAIYYAQAQWPTILNKRVAGFVPDLISASLYDFHALSKQQS